MIHDYSINANCTNIFKVQINMFTVASFHVAPLLELLAWVLKVQYCNLSKTDPKDNTAFFGTKNRVPYEAPVRLVVYSYIESRTSG